MNRGLDSNPWREGLGALRAYSIDVGAPQGPSGVSECRNPFGVPVVGRSVFKCIAAIHGFNVGDLWHNPYAGPNSTVNTTQWGYTRNDGQKLATIIGSGGSGCGRYGLLIDGTTNFTCPIANFREIFLLVGPINLHDPSLARLPALAHFDTPSRPAAFSANYVEQNLLGRQPAFVNALYKCVNPDIGYVVGDVVDRGHHQQSGGSTVSDCIRTTEKIVELRTPPSGNMTLPHATTGALATMAPANWQVFLEVIG